MPTFFVSYRKFRPIVEGLQACGYSVLEDVWNPRAADLADCDGYLICMYDAMKRPWDTIRLKAKLRAHDIPLLGWNRDAPWNKGAKRRRLWWFRQFRMLDIYAAHSLQGASTFSDTITYLPNAAWMPAYGLADHTLAGMRHPDFYRHDVSFVGNLDQKNFPEFTERAEFFRELELRLRAIGVSCWFQNSRGMSVAEQVEIIQRSRININFGAACDDGPTKSWGLPERCYGVPACGGFLLSEERKHAAVDFVPDLEWASFSKIEECVAKVEYYLANFHHTRDIAERSYHRVVKEHTYVHRAATLVDAARQWRIAHRVHLAALKLPVTVRRVSISSISVD